MPSLDSLSKFISSFADVANEKDNLAANGIKFNYPTLPDKEAAPMEFTRRMPSPSTDFLEDLFDEMPQEDASDGGFDFNTLLGGLPSDAQPQQLGEPPSLDDLFDGINQPSYDPDITGGEDVFNEFQDAAQPLDDSSSVADDSMDSFPMPDEHETPAFENEVDSEEYNPADMGAADIDSESPDSTEGAFEDLGAIDLGGESWEGAASEDTVSDSAFDIPSDEGVGDSAYPDEDSIDMGGESPALSEELPNDSFFEDMASSSAFDESGEGEAGLANPDENSIDMGGESFELPQEPASESFSDTDFNFAGAGEDTAPVDFGSDTSGGGEEFALPSGGGDEDTGAAIFDNFGSEFESEAIDLDTGAEEQGPEVISSGAIGDEEFNIPGLEEMFNKTKTAPAAAPARKKGLFKRKKAVAKEEIKADDDVEEIRLTDDQLASLLKTLSFYPLNLRVACEELIAEKVILPQQLSKLIRLLVNGAGYKETAAFAEELLGKPIVIPRGFEKMTGAAFEAEQASFAYIFVHNFLPVLRLFAIIAAFAASVFYLSYKFIYIPLKAESLYKRGYERIPAGEYQRANQLFNEAFATHRKKKWFYLYAEEFRDQRRYLLAEEKYDDLLRYYPRDKKGVLDYANLQTYYLLNYDKANRLLQQQLLDYAPDDYDGLISAGDNFLLWGDSDPSKFYDKYEDARFSYARILAKYGWTAPVMERMMKYFIRTDNLKETLNTRAWFENNRKSKLSPSSIAELGGYLLDKQLEEVKGVPDAYIESIESVRGMLLQAVREEPELPEPHYHLARYYHSLGNTYEERLTLENAIRAFDLAKTESVRRRLYRVDTHYRYANMLINNREFFPAEEQVVRGIQLYEDFVSRNLISASPQLGQLYGMKGDLEYFVKSGDMNASLNNYRLAERYGYSPPEVQYRMGSAYYHLQDWRNALEYFVKASPELPMNRRLLYALGNASYQRGDYFAAQGYYNRLLDLLENQRVRMPVLMPNDNSQFLELGERIMMAMNNAGVVYEILSDQTTNRNFRSTALAYYAESARAWDTITRNPQTMTRMQIAGSPGLPGINLGYLNASNAMRPSSNYSPEIFVRIDKDVLEPSRWEELAPGGGLQ